jgi:hypothetical protein
VRDVIVKRARIEAADGDESHFGDADVDHERGRRLSAELLCQVTERLRPFARLERRFIDAADDVSGGLLPAHVTPLFPKRVRKFRATANANRGRVIWITDLPIHRAASLDKWVVQPDAATGRGF